MTPDPDITAALAMAELSAEKGDYDRASLLLKGALNQAEKNSPNDLRQRLDIMQRLADVYHITGQWVDALMFLDNIVQTASEQKLNNVIGEALITSGTILSKKGKWEIAQRKFEHAESLSGLGGRRTIRAKAYVGKGIIYWRKGQGDEAIVMAKKALDIAKEADDNGLMGDAHALIANARFSMGDIWGSLGANEKALEHYQKSGNAIEESRILNNTGETYKLMGDYEEAIEHFNSGLRATSGKGVRRSMAYLLTNLAECHIRRGRNLESRTFATMAEDNTKGIEDEYLYAQLKFVWALIYEFEENAEKANDHFMSALLKMFSLGIPFDTGIMQLAYGKFLINQDRKEDASRYLTDAVTSFKRAGTASMVEKAEEELSRMGAK